MRILKMPKLPAIPALGLIAALLVVAVAPPASAVPLFIYYNDTGDPTIYKYIIGNPVSSFEINRVEVDAPGAVAVVSPPGWTGAVSGPKVVWETTPGSVVLPAAGLIGGFEINGNAQAAAASYTISGQQFSYTERVVAPVPEPGTLLALGSGVLAMAGFWRRHA